MYMKITFTPEQDQYLQLQMTRAYHQGLREGVELYAHWRDGVQYVGTTGRTLKEALNTVYEEEQRILETYKKLSEL
jgi:hypothetical protein